MKIIFEGRLYESSDNPIKGGVGDNSHPNKKALAKGIRIEKEHVGDINDPKKKAIAADIAKDHLKEFPEYYDELEKMEKKLENKK